MAVGWLLDGRGWLRNGAPCMRALVAGRPLYTAFGLLDRHPRTVGSDGGAVVLNAFVVDVSNHFGLSNEVGGAVELRTLYSWTGARFFLQGS